jgi:hypothetical protein
MSITTAQSFGADQKKTVSSKLNQVIDVIQADISGSGNRRVYESFLSSSTTAELTSSLYQTVYDQAYTLQTANPVMDMTVGLFYNSARNNLVNLESTENSDGQLIFDPETTIMMREKVNIYRQYANFLLGDPSKPFALSGSGTVPSGDYGASAIIMDACAFINIKRLFSRDGIRKETFAMRLYETIGTDGSLTGGDTGLNPYIIADIGAESLGLEINEQKVGVLKRAADTTKAIGLIFYDAGILVLNLGSFDGGSNTDSGDSEAVGVNELRALTLNAAVSVDDVIANGGISMARTVNGTLYPHLYVSGSIDDIVDHLAETRFGNGDLTAIAFQNETKIQSSIYICRAGIDQFNSSNNTTWQSSMESAVGDTNNYFTYITSVALMDSDGDILGIAKLNRPIEKQQNNEVSIRIRLDF